MKTKRRLSTILCALLCFCHSVQAQKTFHGNGPDDVLRLTPWVAVFGLKLCGVESHNDWPHLAAATAASGLFCVASTYGVKSLVDKERPDGTDNHSFPSGHASICFAGAHVLYKEYAKTSPWIPVAGYAVAVATSVDRVCRNRHDWVDVAAGAALGVASAELGYWLTGRIFPKSEALVAFSPNAVSLSVCF